MKKVKVWQVGYTTYKDWILRNKENAECRDVGYVMVEDNDKNWQETVWDLLNWSCWTDEKPSCVHSPLDHCNSDIILRKENSKTYYIAKSFGWGNATSLNSAIDYVKLNNCNMWLFYDVKRVGGSFFAKNGKAYMEKENGECEEINF